MDSNVQDEPDQCAREHLRKNAPPPPPPPITEFDEDGYPKTTYQFQTDAVSKLYPEQITDATRLLYMQARGEKGMILANGTGTGKTYVYGAAIAEWHKAGKKGTLFVPNKDTKEQTEQALEFIGVPKDAANIYTYDDLSRGKVSASEGDYLIFDEAHKIKNMFNGQRSKRAEAAIEFIKKSKFTVFSTATPFEHPKDTKYMVMAGLTQGKKFDQFITQYGVTLRSGYNGSTEYVFDGSAEDLQRLHEDLKKRGYLTKRMFVPAAGLVEAENPDLPLDDRWLDLLDEVSDRLTAAAKNSYHKGLVSAQKTMLLRQILERAKLEASIPLIKQELAQGRSVAVFTQYRSEKSVQDDLEDNEDIDSEVTQEIRDALKGLEFNLKSPTLALKEAFPDAEMYTGAQTESQLRKAKTRFNKGEAKVLILTGAKGGTGLSFHDTVGNRPTSQVIVTLPWSATELDQMTGRVVRKGLASNTKIIMPVSQAGFERKLSGIIGAKMQMMGYTVRGGAEGISQEALKAFEYGYAKAKKGGLEEVLANVPEKAMAQAGPVTSHGLEAALPLTDMFGNVVPTPAPKVKKPKVAPQGGGSYKEKPGYRSETRRYIKPNGKTYTKTVYVKDTGKVNHSNEQLSLFDHMRRASRSTQGSLFSKAQFIIYVRKDVL
jgi:hypothetical protein